MSGSGGGGYGGGFDPTPDTCETLVINTQLSSPKDSVVAVIKEGDILDIDIRQQGTTTIVIALHQGNVAGGIAAPQVQKLRECIQGGTKYMAKVTAKNDGQVRVRISAVRH